MSASVTQALPVASASATSTTTSSAMGGPASISISVQHAPFERITITPPAGATGSTFMDPSLRDRPAQHYPTRGVRSHSDAPLSQVTRAQVDSSLLSVPVASTFSSSTIPAQAVQSVASLSVSVAPSSSSAAVDQRQIQGEDADITPRSLPGGRRGSMITERTCIVYEFATNPADRPYTRPHSLSADRPRSASEGQQKDKEDVKKT